MHAGKCSLSLLFLLAASNAVIRREDTTFPRELENGRRWGYGGEDVAQGPLGHVVQPLHVYSQKEQRFLGNGQALRLRLMGNVVHKFFQSGIF